MKYTNSPRALENRLARSTTPWPIWFAIFPMLGFGSLTLMSFLPLDTAPAIIRDLLPLLQFVILAIIPLALVRLFSKKKITAAHLGFDQPVFTKRNVIVILAVFVVTHLVFFLISELGFAKTDAPAEFIASGLGKGFFTDLTTIIATTIFAPIIEELLYRGVLLRSVHDGLLRLSPRSRSIFSFPAIVSVTVTALAFVLPHVSNFGINALTLAYFLTSAGFSIVYLLTGSMIAAMVSHSLQSAFAFTQLLIFGKGAYPLSPVILAISILCPVIVYFLGKLIAKLFKNQHSYSA